MKIKTNTNRLTIKSQDEKIEFEGDFKNPQNLITLQEIIQDTLEKSELRHQRIVRLEQEKLKKSSNIDAIVILFMSISGSLIIFLIYMIASFFMNGVRPSFEYNNTNIQPVEMRNVQ